MDKSSPVSAVPVFQFPAGNWIALRQALAEERDALLQATKSTSDPVVRVDNLLRLCEQEVFVDVDQARVWIAEASTLAAANHYPEGHAAALLSEAQLIMVMPDMETVTGLCNRAMELLQGQPLTPTLCQAYLELGWLANYQGDLGEALNWALRGVDATERLVRSSASAPVLRMHVLLNDLLAWIHKENGNFEESLALFAQMAGKAVELEDYALLSRILNDYSLTLLAAGRGDDAEQIARKCVEITQELGLHVFQPVAADSLADILLSRGHWEEAETILTRAYEALVLRQQRFPQGFLLCTLGRISLAAGKYDEAVQQLSESRAIMEELGVRTLMAMVHRYLSQAWELKGEISKAFEEYRLYHEAEERTRGRETMRKIHALHSSYRIQLAERDAEIERLNNQELQAEIARNKEIRETLELMVNTDTLTGLKSRHQFFILAEREISRALRYRSEVSILIIDVDWFKRINDTMGHTTGDQVLTHLGAVMRQNLRDLDIPGRYGGEEFAVMLPETDSGRAWLVAERLRNAIADEEFPTQAGNLRITVSVGIAGLDVNVGTTKLRHREAARELAVIIDRADQALYMAKATGRNRTIMLE